MNKLPPPDSGEIVEILAELSKMPLHAPDHTIALNTIASLCKRALRCQLCTITTINADGRHLYQEACAGPDGDDRGYLANKKLLGDFVETNGVLDGKILKSGGLLERYGLRENGQGVANPSTARRYGLDRMMAQPLQSDGDLRGYINVFASGPEPFTDAEKSLLEVFGNQIYFIQEQLRLKSYKDILRILNDVSRDISSFPPGKALKRVADGVCNLLDVKTCVVWEFDEEHPILRVAAMSGERDDDYRLMTLDPSDPRLHDRARDPKGTYIADVTSPESTYIGKEAASRRGWVSMFTVPILFEDKLSGMLDVYSDAPRQFEKWEREAFALFAQETAQALHSVEKRVEELNRILEVITEATDKNELFKLTLHESLKLVGCFRGWIGVLDGRTGELEIVAQEGQPSLPTQPRLEAGITGKSLREERTIRIDNVLTETEYERSWSDTRSELAVPLVMQDVEVRVGKEIAHGSKRIGVLNVESATIGAFFSIDEHRLQMLVRQAALVYDRIETDRKFAGLSQIEVDFAHVGKIEPDHILKAITNTLEFEFVNISLVDRDKKRIKSHYVTGLSEVKAEEFKKLADHSLDSNDIQADIVRSRDIEVIGKSDPRLDTTIYDKFGHAGLIRVFIPMISPSGSGYDVVGTVEAGYRRTFRPYIYERDIRLLRSLVDFVTVALQQSREDVIEKLMHDLRAPAAALWQDVDFLKRRYKKLKGYRIQNKLDDLSLDSALVLLQVSEVERYFGGPLPETARRHTVVFRDIVIKSVNQLRGFIQKSGYDTKKVHYEPQNAGRIQLYLDPARLNDVVLNILMNAIKYAEEDPDKFAIRIDLDETADDFIIKFKDWGIGVVPRYSERIFEGGFRSPEARAQCVTGSGLGLNISRGLMREMGGDLRLTRFSKPTEFHIILAKSLKEARSDTVRR
jgi:signal transduction histidine kinase/putative methionine-R-sulfoxide reductase with GAF domain